ncbi:cadherin domain-containing protein [Aliivibrio wodanis]|uniref:cadherin domain-containing protein n=1 Tax=Aliivibrio wodanis TaxID=80852 RepID=UPI00406D022C
MALKTTENEKQIIVIDVNGNLKLASPGDSIFPGEVSLNKELGELLVEVVDLPEESDDITAILDAILDGQDPSLITEAPAAGESGGSSLTASTEIERVGRSSIAETNFDTSSLQSIGLSETQSLTLLEQYKVYRETGELVVPEKNNVIGSLSDVNVLDNTISENAVVGDVVNITGQALDPDGDEVTYSLSDDANGLFQIDPITGVVTVARDGLDFENATSHEIVIVATSTDGSSSEETFIIGVENADGTTPGQGDTDNDIGAVTDSDGGANTVSENAAVGDVVNITGQAVDPDGDEVTYSLSDDADGLFQIDPITGVVTVARDGLDFESATSHEIVIVATSTDGSSSEETFVIGVENADDTTTPPEPENNDVGAVTDSDGGANTVSENAAVGDVVNITGQAVDPDGDEVTYSLSDDANGLFQIDPITGVVTVARDGLDFESETSHEIVIVATSTDGSSSEETFIIGVENADGTTPGQGDTDNDIGAVTDSDGSENTISENAVVGDVVNITGQALDPDGDEVTYSLSDDANGLFQIDPITGVVTVARDGLDFENATSHEIVIVATSTDGSSSEETFIIGVENADGTTPGQGDTDNDIGAVTDSDGGANTVSENAAVGDVVNITGQAVDPDGDEVSYSLSDDANGLFQIDPITGVVTVARDGLDFENATSHEIVIVATSTDGSSSEETFVIGVEDEDDTTTPPEPENNDVGAVTDRDGGANTVSENAAVGDVVNITGQAVDPDGDEVTYSLSDDADGLFQIDPITGVVTVARDGLDFESATSHEIVIVATSTDGSSSEETFVIGVENADDTTTPPEPENNDVGAVTDSDGSENTISENAVVGDVVNITGQALDPDGDEVTYSLSDDADGLFQIDPITGVVTVARDGLDFESATSHEIVIVATSTDGSSSEETFVIGVENADDTTTPPEPENNDVGAVTDSDGGANKVSENAAVGDVVNITGQAIDLDGDEVTYSLSDDADGLFQIDPITGVVTVARDGLDFESATSHEIVIVATSTDGSSSEETFVIGVKDKTYGEETDEPADGITPASVSITDNTGDGAEVISGTEKADITVSFGEGVSSGTAQVVISDSDGDTADITLNVTLNSDGSATVDGGYTVTNNNDGTYTINDVDVKTLADGTLTANATFIDQDGNTAGDSDSESDTAISDTVAKDITYGEETDEPADGITPASVSITDNTGDGAEVISGTEKADITVSFGEGVSSGTAQVVISDSDGDTADITLNVTLNSDGSATVDGGYTVTNNNDGTYTINDVDVKTLADGTLTANATFIDQDGNTAGDSDSESDTAISDTVAKDITYGEETDEPADGITPASVSITDNTGDGAEVISGTEKADITVSFGEGVSSGTAQVVISDSDGDTADITLNVTLNSDGSATVDGGYTVTNNNDGTYTINDVDVKTLADGTLTANATFIDQDGNTAGDSDSESDTAISDTVAKDITYGEETDEPADGITPASVSITDNTGDGAEVISGTEKADITVSFGEGVSSGTAQVVISDSDGDTADITLNVTLNSDGSATVDGGYTVTNNNDGTYTINDVDVKTLADGTLTANATFIDQDGNTAGDSDSESDTAISDTVAKDITYGEETDEPADGITPASVSITDNTGDGAEVISGTEKADITVSFGEGVSSGTAQVVISDSDGDTADITLNVTLNSDGSATVDGGYTVTNNNDGTYTINDVDVKTLADGTLTANATFIDQDGNTAGDSDSESDTAISDTVAKDITYGEETDEPADGITPASVSITDNTGDGAEVISGTEKADITVSFGEGVSSGTAQVVISDSDGDTADITLNVTLNSDGSATVDGGYTVTNNNDGTYTINDVDVKTLADGTLTANATFIDQDGNTAGDSDSESDTAISDTVAKDITYGEETDEPADGITPASVSITDNTGDGAEVISGTEKADITVSFGEGVSSGTAQVVISDSDGDTADITLNVTLNSDGSATVDGGYTVTNNNDGTYTINDVDVKTLADGTLTANATFIDQDGNTAGDSDSESDTAISDTVAKDITYGEETDEPADGITPASVSITDNTGDGAEVISGTEKADITVSFGEGVSSGTAQVVISDSDGDTADITLNVTLNSDGSATVDGGYTVTNNNDGTYTINDVDVKTLADGTLTANATFIDQDGNTAGDSDSESDTAISDTVAKDITYGEETDEPADGITPASVSITDNTGDGAEVISGTEKADITVSFGEGVSSGTAQVVISDSDGDTADITLNVTLNSDGSATVDGGYTVTNNNDGTYTINDVDVKTLADGTLTANATFIDQDGNTAGDSDSESDTAISDTVAKDITYGEETDEPADGITPASVSITDNTGDGAEVISGTEKADITVSFGEGVSSGTAQVVISDSDGDTADITLNVTLNSDGSATVDGGYTVTNNNDGTYTINDVDVKTLADGTLTANATFIDQDGNTAGDSDSESDTAISDTVAKDITYGEETDEPADGITPASVSITDNTGDGAEVISGTEKADITVSFGEGVSSGTAQVVISDSDGDTADITLNVTLNSDGSATVDGGYTVTNNNDGTYTINDVDVKTLADGTLTANATFIDQDGNTAGDSDSESDTAISDTVAKDITYGEETDEPADGITPASVSITDNTGDGAEVISGTEKADITVSFGEGVSSGTAQVVISDSDGDTADITLNVTLNSDGSATVDGGYTVTNNNDGTYTINDVDVKTLADGTLTANATFIDQDGNTAGDSDSESDTAISDTVAKDITYGEETDEPADGITPASVSITDNTGDGAEVISGTEKADITVSFGEGVSSGTAQVVISDSDGDTADITLNVTLNSDGSATVDGGYTVTNNNDGTYTINDVDVKTLADGTLTANATFIDQDGNTAGDSDSESDTAISDTVAKDITYGEETDEPADGITPASVSITDNTGDGAEVISGTEKADITVSFGEGVSSGTAQVVISDSDGDTADITLNVTLNSDGSATVDGGYTVTNNNDGTYTINDVDVKTLADGTLTANATFIDQDGNTAGDSDSESDTAISDTVAKDITYGEETDEPADGITPASVSITDNTGDGAEVISGTEKADITVSFGEGVSSGTAQVVISDSDGDTADITLNVTLNSDGSATVDGGYTVTNNNDGTYTINDVDVKTLADGTLTANATFIDQDGNTAGDSDSESDTAISDTVAKDITYGEETDEPADGITPASVSITDNTGDGAEVISGTEKADITVSFGEGVSSGTAQVVISDSDGDTADITLNVTLNSDGSATVDGGYTVTNNNDGTYTINDVDVKTLADGTLTANATFIDQDGNTAGDSDSESDTAISDTVAKDITYGEETDEPADGITPASVSITDNTGDGAEVISGTEKADITVSFGEGVSSGTAQVVISDSDGDTADITLNVTLNSDGSATVDGGYTVTNNNDGTYTINDVDVKTLADGTLTANATFIDQDGNTAGDSDSESDTAISDTVAKDITYGEETDEPADGITPASVSITDNTGDGAEVISGTEKADITVSFGEGVSSGTAQVVISDSDGDTADITLNVTLNSDGSATVDGGYTVTNNNDGTYTINDVDVKTLADGTLTANATFIDQDGNTAGDSDSESDTAISDTVAKDITYGEETDEPADGITPASVSITDNTGDGAEVISGTEKADITVSFGEGVSSGTAQVVISDSDGDTADITLNVTLNSDGSATVDGGYTVTNNNDGTYTINDVDVKTLADGTLTANATFIDQDGNTAGDSDSESDTAISDTVAKDITYGEETDEPADGITPASVSITDNTGDGAEVISGTEKADITVSFGEGVSSGTAQVVISDSDGDTADITLNVTLNSDGSATVDGGYTVTNNNDGTYTINDVDVKTLADGTLTANATFIDQDGNTAGDSDSESDTAISDTVAKDITYGEETDEPADGITPASVSITDNTGDGAEVISGTEKADITVSFGEGVSSGTAQVVISDSDGDTADITLNVTLNSDGSATVDGGYTVTNNNDGTYTINDVDVKTLADGTLTANATFIDQDGNTAGDSDSESDTAISDTVAKDITYGEETDEPADGITPASVSITDNTGDGAEVISGTEKADITVSFGEGVSSGTAQVVISDSDGDTADITLNVTLNSDGSATVDGGYTVTNNNDGTYTINDVDVKTLADGTLTANATFIDQDGNTAGDSDSESDTAISDTVAKDITYGEETDEPADGITPASVSITDNTGDGAEVISGTEKADITVSFGEGVSSGTAQVVISDSDGDTADITLNVTLNSDGSATVDGGYTVTNNNDGTYTINDVDVKTLADGTLTANATFIDQDGNTAGDSDSESDTAISDTVAKDITYGEETDEPADGITPASVSITDNTGDGAEVISGTEKADITVSFGEGVSSGTAQVVISDSDGDTADMPR